MFLAEQVRLDRLIARTGLNDRGIAEIIGVSQPTAWRLRHGRVAKISRYVKALEKHLGVGEGDISDADMIADLVGYARQLPDLRAALVSLHQLMRYSE